MEIDLSRFRAAFFEEAGEHLENMEAGLLALETSGGDREVLNTIFRAAHSIKGASSTFGMDQVARFTHVLENLLDRMRDGEVLPTMELCELLLKSTDVLTALIQAEKNQTAVPEQMEATFSALQQYSANPSEVSSAPAIATASVSAPAGRTFQLDFKPSLAFFHFGQNPLFLIDELQKLGTDFSIQADDSHIPSLSQIDPEASYLSWTITLTTTNTETALLDVFMFVDAESIPAIREVQTSVVAKNTAADQTTAAKQIAGSPKSFVEGKDFGLFEQAAPPNAEAPGKNGANEPGKISAAIPDRRVGEDRRVEPQSSTGGGSPASTTSETVRVDRERLDKMINQIGELVIGTSMVEQDWSRFHPDMESAALVQLGKIVRDLQEMSLSLRMVPIAASFQKMTRIVRDLSHRLGKQIHLETCKRRREIVALGGRKVQRPACLNYSLERGWQLTARGLFITSTLHRSRLSPSSVFVASHHEVGSSGRRLRGCDSGVSAGPVLPQSAVHC